MEYVACTSLVSSVCNIKWDIKYRSLFRNWSVTALFKHNRTAREVSDDVHPHHR